MSTHTLNFGEALTQLKNGKQVCRDGKGMWLSLVTEWSGPFATGCGEFKFLPFILMKTATNEFVPWLASQTDILSEDWGLIE
jgi:hypothetical protein